jgi:hypothetical protein
MVGLYFERAGCRGPAQPREQKHQFTLHGGLRFVIGDNGRIEGFVVFGALSASRPYALMANGIAAGTLLAFIRN